MSFSWANPYPTVRTPVFARNVVSTSQPLAAQAGLRILQNGGNAVDAAIAAAAVITMTEPCSNGLGADNFAIVWDPETRRLHGLNSSGTAPAAWTPEYFARKYREPSIPQRGWDAVTVPGAVAGWSLLHGKFGKRTFADVLAPAIDYAERGFAVSPTVQDKWTRATPLLRTLPGFADHFLPKGRAPEVGEHFVLAGAARPGDGGDGERDEVSRSACGHGTSGLPFCPAASRLTKSFVAPGPPAGSWRKKLRVV